MSCIVKSIFNYLKMLKIKKLYPFGKTCKLLTRRNFVSWEIEQKEEAKAIKKNKYDYVRLKFGDSARRDLLKGVLTMSTTVAKTYGPLGKNVAIEFNDKSIITKDGVTVAKNISITKRSENIGCRLLSLVSGSTNEHAGDGTTTSTVLAGEIVRKGTQLVSLGFHPLDIKKGIEHAADIFIKELSNIKVLVRNKEDLYSLAMITTNKDKEISQIVTEALINLGLSGIISLEESPTGESRLIIYQGMSLPHGLASIEFINDKGDKRYLG
jgi:chaperonin GroEL